MKFCVFCSAFGIFCSAFGVVSAQNLRDSKGTDFWLGFPPTDYVTNNPTLTVYVTSEFNTRVTIVGRSRTGQLETRNIVLAPNTILQEDFSRTRYELVGSDFPSDRNNANGDCERPNQASIHVTSDKEITVYASTRDRYTSDAWLVLPTDALGNDHRVFSFMSDAQVDTSFFGQENFRNAFPSQFLIIATEDNTTVNMTVRNSRTAVANGALRQVTLDQGESYLVQAYVSGRYQNDDLTGSSIRSSKPIALISGHYRAQVPIRRDEGSRDVLIEQVPSVDTWGKSAIVVPLKLPTDYVKDGSQDVPILRILTLQDSTNIRINGSAPFPQVRAGTWDRPLTSVTVVEANKPIVCGIIDRTSGTANVTHDGDPSLILIPPTEQYLNHYQVVSIEPGTQNNAVYNQHFITVTVPTSQVGSLTLNGATVSTTFTPIASTTYSYTHIPVNAGSHILHCDSTFGIVVYGYGPAESYGYTGGMAFERLYRPVVQLRVLDAFKKPGEEMKIVAIVDSISDKFSLDALAPSNLSSTTDFNRTLFVPDFASNLTADYSRGKVSFNYSFDSLAVGDTVSFHDGTVTLGNAVNDSIDLIDVVWENASGDPLDIDTRVIKGELTIDGICLDKGPRLFDPFAISQQQLRIFDLNGKQRPALAPGWNLVVKSDGYSVTTTRVFVSD